MAINRTNIAKQLLPGLNAIFGTEYKNVDNEHLPLFDAETSERAFEEEVLMSGFSTAPYKTEGAGVTYDTAQEVYTARYINQTVALAFAITEEAMEDNLYDTFAKVRAKALARAMANTKQVVAANIFNNGFSTSYPVGDGAAFFSASHVTLAAGSQSNTSGAVDFSESTLETMLINITLIKDDKGILVGAMPQSLHIPPQLLFVAERVLKSPGQSGNANNDLNAVRNLSYVPKGYFVNRRFTDTNAWFVRTDVPNGTKNFTRVPLQTKMEPDFDTGNMRYKARERYAFGVSDWRCFFGASGSS